MATTRFTELTGCSVPVQQAPMGAVSPPALAAAVAEAGGVGTLSSLRMTADQVVRASTRRAGPPPGCSRSTC
ncbi:nitronate monooxygenase [Geodermatophilus sp. CPCC 205761]|uniref:nitronate monooxygenase n=1 Tax=Geodermatophilus sp. CPCC 205761 TaxID=2936597 RepID=UPI003F533BD6